MIFSDFTSFGFYIHDPLLRRLSAQSAIKTAIQMQIPSSGLLDHAAQIAATPVPISADDTKSPCCRSVSTDLTTAALSLRSRLTDVTARALSWSDQFERWIVGPVPPDITGQQGKLLNRRMRADEKVW